MPYKEKTIEKKYFTIGEVATKFDVATSLIRFWEGEFDTLNPKKNHKGNRRYTKEDIEHIKVIFHLVKERGFTLQGAKDLISQEGESLEDKLEILNSLKSIRSFLVEMKQQL